MMMMIIVMHSYLSCKSDISCLPREGGEKGYSWIGGTPNFRSKGPKMIKIYPSFNPPVICITLFVTSHLVHYGHARIPIYSNVVCK